MSTRINVTVGDGGLLDRNAQQTAANRQARVLADQRATAEAEGVERRATDRTAAGLDPLTGFPASTPSSASTINRFDQEPAANRRGGDGILLVPQSPYTDFGGTLSGIFGSSRGGRVLFSRFIYEDTTEYVFGQFSPELRFALGEGPTGSNALALDYSLPFEDYGIFTNYTQGEVFDPVNAVFVPQPLPSGVWYNTFLDSGNNLVSPFTPIQRAALQYAKTPVSYDGLSSALVNTANAGPYLYKRLDGEIDQLSFSKRARDYRNVTHEFYIRFTDDTSKLGETRVRVGHADNSLPLETRRIADCVVQVDGISFRLEVEEDRTTVLKTFVRTSPTSQAAVSDDVINNLLTLNITAESGVVEQQDTLVYLASSSSTNRFNFPLDENIAPLSGVEWCHFALVRTYDSTVEKPVWSFYWRGVRLFTATASSTWESTNALAPIGARITLRSNRGQYAPVDYLLPAIHGYRFTPKALYTEETFTPPAKIAQLA
jgi:hypothetical protein